MTRNVSLENFQLALLKYLALSFVPFFPCGFFRDESSMEALFFLKRVPK